MTPEEIIKASTEEFIKRMADSFDCDVTISATFDHFDMQEAMVEGVEYHPTVSVKVTPL
jgi:hypothetical protein